MKRLLKSFGLIILLLLVIFPIYYYLKKVNSKTENYTLEKVVNKKIKNYIFSSGIVLPKEEVEIKSRISGVLDEYYFKVGDTVKKGDAIAKVKVIPNLENLIKLESNIKLEKNKLSTEKLKYQRNKKLYEKGVIARAEFEQTELSYLNIKENYNKVLNEYSFVKSGNSRNNKKNSNTLIKSTINGMVTSIPSEIGSTVTESNNFSAGTTIAKIANIEEMVFEGKVKEYELKNLKEGMTVFVNTSISNEMVLGKLIEISTSGENEDGMIFFGIKCSINNLRTKRTGFSATARILIRESKSNMAIKEECIVFENDSSYVYIHINKEIAEKKNVESGVSDGVFTEVVSGLKEKQILRCYGF